MYGKQWYGGDAGDVVESFYGDPMGLASFFASAVGGTVISAAPLFTGFLSGALEGDTNIVASGALRLVQTGAVAAISGASQINTPVGLLRLVAPEATLVGESLVSTPLAVIRFAPTVVSLSGESTILPPVALTRILRTIAVEGETRMDAAAVKRLLGFVDITGETVIVVGADAIFDGNFFAVTNPSHTGSDRDSYAWVGIIT